MTNFVGNFMAGIVFLLFSTTYGSVGHAADAPPPERYVVRDDGGGSVEEYKRALEYMLENDMAIKVDGVCKSSCTLLMSTEYDLDFCVTRTAEFHFHEPFWGRLTPLGPKVNYSLPSIVKMNKLWHTDIYQKMPLWVQQYIDDNGGVPSAHRGAGIDDMFVINYDMMRPYVKTCGD